MIGLEGAQSFFWLALGVSIFMVAVFISAALYQMARAAKQANDIVQSVRSVAAEIEEDFSHLRDRFGSVIGSVAASAKSAKAISGLIGSLAEASEKRTSRKRK